MSEQEWQSTAGATIATCRASARTLALRLALFALLEGREARPTERTLLLPREQRP